MTVIVNGPSGSEIARQTFQGDALPPSDASGGYATYNDGQPQNAIGPLTGVALDTLLGQAGLNVAPENLRTVSVSALDGAPQCALQMSSMFDDFGASTDAAWPFEEPNPPIIAPYSTTFAAVVVPIRKAGHGDATVTDGAYCLAGSTQGLQITANVSTTILKPEVHADRVELTGPGPVQLTATVTDSDPSDQLTWTWKYDATHSETVQTGAGRTSTVTHTFPAGTWYPSVTVSGSNGSAGATSSQVRIHVVGPTQSTQPTQPAPGPSLGTGGPTAPQQGPQTGTGPLVAGNTNRTNGAGQAGPSAPASSRPTSSGSGSAAPTDGAIVGYLLSDGTAALEPAAQKGAKPLDDSAMAARNGVSSTRIGEWLLAAAVVVSLLVVGAGSERRRPLRARRR